MHWVPHKKNEENPIKLSSKPSSVFNANFWASRITESIENHKIIEIEPRVDGSQVLHQSELLIQCNDTEYVEYTQDIAEYLHRAQNNGNISDGFMIVFTGITDFNNKFVCILKLEGLSASEAVFDDEDSTFNFKQIDNIIITNKTKIFKMFYVEYDGVTTAKMVALDDQRSGNELSNFWLYDFLGCKLVETPPNLTKQFFSFINKFSDDKRLSTNESINIKNALYTEMNSNTKTLSLKKFKEKYIPEEFQQYFDAEVKKNQISEKDFPKEFDNKFKKQITTRKYLLEGEIIAIIPQSTIQEEKFVTITKKTDGEYMKINSKIKKYQK